MSTTLIEDRGGQDQADRVGSDGRLKHFQDVCSIQEIQRVDLHVDMAHAGDEKQAVEMMENLARKLEDESLGRCVEVSVNPFDRV